MMNLHKKATIKIKSHPDVDFTEAPEWATHAGYDTFGWHWFDHVPYVYTERDFVKGLLGDLGYPKGHCERFLAKDRCTNPPELLTYITLPRAKDKPKPKVDATAPTDWSAKRDEWVAIRKRRADDYNRLVALEAVAKAAGLLFID